VLRQGIDGYLATYATAQEDAEAFLANGERPVPGNVSSSELAAYTALAGVLLNLDETITKE
jgi:hypothetical protein